MFPFSRKRFPTGRCKLQFGNL